MPANPFTHRKFHPYMKEKSFLRLSGDHRQWNVYRKSVIVSDVTEMFVRRYLSYSSRTAEQMRQAARSCKQNIVEGVADKTVSFEVCLKLIGVAKGSLRELIEDYGDFLRQNGYVTWPVDDPRTLQTRKVCRNDCEPAVFVRQCGERNAETVANIMLTQCAQLDAMLSGVLNKMGNEFEAEGGLKEQMSNIRRTWRRKNLGY